jgi:hypothetical protein
MASCEFGNWDFGFVWDFEVEILNFLMGRSYERSSGGFSSENGCGQGSKGDLEGYKAG